MTNLVEQLREHPRYLWPQEPMRNITGEAADEIERLRSEIERAESALEAARREGAEEMRAQALRIAQTAEEYNGSDEWAAGYRHAATMIAADIEMADTIRALPTQSDRDDQQ